MPELGTSGSVGATGEQSPVATRQTGAQPPEDRLNHALNCIAWRLHSRPMFAGIPACFLPTRQLVPCQSSIAKLPLATTALQGCFTIEPGGIPRFWATIYDLSEMTTLAEGVLLLRGHNLAAVEQRGSRVSNCYIC